MSLIKKRTSSFPGSVPSTSRTASTTTSPSNSSKKLKTQKSPRNVSLSNSVLTSDTSTRNLSDNETETEIKFEKIEEAFNSKKTSWVWGSFKEFKVKKSGSSTVCSTNRVYCQISGCQHSLSFTSSTERMIKHLKRDHDLEEIKNNDNNLPPPSVDEQEIFIIY